METKDDGLWAFKFKARENSEARDHWLFSTEFPHEHELRCKLHVGVHPEPNNILYVRNRILLQYFDPGQFQKGAIKNHVKWARKQNIQWREDGLKAFAKRLKLDPAIFPAIPEECPAPKFNAFGPRESLIDSIVIDFAEILPKLIFILIIEFIVLSAIYLTPIIPISFYTKACFLAQMSMVIIGFCFWARYMMWHGDLAKARSNGGNFIGFGRLKRLLKDLIQQRAILEHQGIEVLAAAIKSRSHPDKNAYSININSPMKMTIKKKQVRVTLNIHILAPTVDRSPIVFYWFDTSGNPFRVKEVLSMIEKIQSQFWRLITDIGDETKFAWDHKYLPGEYEEWYQSYIEPRLKWLKEDGLIIQENITN